MAVIKQIRNVDVRFGGEPPTGWIPLGASPPPDTPIRTVKIDFEIHKDKSGFFFVYRGPDLTSSGDSWHQSLSEALECAKKSFGIKADDWESVDSQGK